MRYLLLFCLLLCAGAGAAEDRLQVEGYTLENGLHVLLKPTRDRGHVAIRLVVGVGFQEFECADRELPHLLEHLLFSGLDDSGEAGLEARMQALGGEWNAFTGEADTTFVVEAPARRQREALDLLLASLINTPLDESRLAAAKRVVERESGGHYGARLDTQEQPHAAHRQLAVELGLECAEPPSLAHLDLQRVNRLRDDWYLPNNMALIVVGDLDRRLPAYLERSYAELPVGDLPAPREIPQGQGVAEARRILFDGLVGDQASLHWLLPEPFVGDQDHATWELLRDYLNWTLYQELRIRRGLAYAPWSERSALGAASFVSLNAELSSDDLGAAEQAMRALAARLRDEGVDAATFERLRHAALARQAWAAQGNSGLADYYWGSLMDYQDGRFADPSTGLRAVTPRQADEALRQLFAEDGYWRIQRPLFSPWQWHAVLAAATAIVLALALLIAWRVRRRRR